MNISLVKGVITLIIRILFILLFTILLFNKNIIENKSITLILILAIVQKISIILIETTDINEFLLNIVISVSTILIALNFIYVLINKVLR